MLFLHRKSVHAIFIVACAAMALSACGGQDDDLPLAFSATLTGAQAEPSNASAATAIGLVTVDPDGRTITASIVANGLSDIDAHIHEGQQRANGPIVFPLSKAPGTVVWSTRAALTRAQLSALENGNYYFDVHSGAFPGGEIRGQIVWRLPDSAQLAALHRVRNQSLLLDQQLAQVEEIEEADDGHFTGIGWGLTVGF